MIIRPDQKVGQVQALTGVSNFKSVPDGRKVVCRIAKK